MAAAIQITRTDWRNRHPDFKGKVQGWPAVLLLDAATGATILVPVEIIEDDNKEDKQKSTPKRLAFRVPLRPRSYAYFASVEAARPYLQEVFEKTGVVMTIERTPGVREIVDERCSCGLGDVRMVTDSDHQRCPKCKGYGRIFTRRAE